MNHEFRAEIDRHKDFLADWLDRQLKRENLGPACIAMLETAIERTAASMGQTYTRDLLTDAFNRLAGQR